MANRILADRYELIEKIGDGGMAVVYKSRDRLLGRLVAIKILKPAFSKDTKFIENFRRESRAAASLTHPNIVAIYDVGSEGSINFIVMELVEGKTLADLINEKGPIPTRDAIAYAKQVCAALTAAHEHQIIHRDVKPHNILLTEDNTAKLTDFGIAKAVDMGTVIGNTGTVLGSVHYLSPEQARGGYVDEKTDIYSLGVVLYEMLTGKVPFDADNPIAVALKHVDEPMPHPTDSNPSIPKELEEIVLKATEKYPVNRYKSAEEMLHALSDANLASIGIFNSPEGYVTRKPEPEAKETSDMTVGIKKADLKAAAATVETEEDDSKPARKERKSIKSFLPNFRKKEREPEEPKPMKPKKNEKGKRSHIGLYRFLAILLAVILAIPLSAGIYKGISKGKDKAPQEVIVPSVIGKTVDEARQILEEKGLNLVEGTPVSSYEYEEGQIVSQDPKSDSNVKTGKTITVLVSKGMLSDTVPSVIGKSKDDAVYLLTNYGYKIGVTKKGYSETVPAGMVSAQSPEGGATAKSGTLVTLTISLGKEDNTVSVPDVRGCTLADATENLLNNGNNLYVGEVSYAPSATVPEGVVISQNPEPKTRVNAESKVDLVISGGQDELAGGNDVEISIDLTKAPKASFDMTIVQVDSNGKTERIIENVHRSDNAFVDTLTGTGEATIAVLADDTKFCEAVVNFNTGAVTWLQ